MSRRNNRFDGDGNYLLPSEREDEIGVDADVGIDDIDLAEQIKAAVPTADDLTHRALLKAKKHADLNSAAPFMRNNPVSVLKGTIGGQMIVQAGQQVQTVNWVGDDAETTSLSVTLAPVEQIGQIASKAGQFFAPYGIIQFGTRGMMVKAEVDMGRGCQFTVSGSSITVQVAMPPDFTPPGSDLISTMRLAGMVSFQRVTHSVTPITRTLYSTLVPNVAQTFIIPAFAKSFSVWRSNLADPITIEVQNLAGGTVYSFPLLAGNVMFDTIPLDGQVALVKVTNTGIFLAATSIIFNLAF